MSSLAWLEPKAILPSALIRHKHMYSSDHNDNKTISSEDDDDDIKEGFYSIKL